MVFWCNALSQSKYGPMWQKLERIVFFMLNWPYKNLNATSFTLHVKVYFGSCIYFFYSLNILYIFFPQPWISVDITISMGLYKFLFCNMLIFCCVFMCAPYSDIIFVLFHCFDFFFSCLTYILMMYTFLYKWWTNNIGL